MHGPILSGWPSISQPSMILSWSDRLRSQKYAAISILATIADDELPSPCASGISLSISTLTGGISLLYLRAMLFAVEIIRLSSPGGRISRSGFRKSTLNSSFSYALIFKNLVTATPMESNPSPRLALVAGIFKSICFIVFQAFDIFDDDRFIIRKHFRLYSRFIHSRLRIFKSVPCQYCHNGTALFNLTFGQGFQKSCDTRI